MIGVGPKDAAKNFQEWLNLLPVSVQVPQAEWLGVTLYVIGGGLLVAGLVSLYFVSLKQIFFRNNFIFTWAYWPDDRDFVPIRPLVQLAEASRIAYERMRGRSERRRNITADVSDIKFSDGSSQPISWFSYALTRRPAIAVFGVHPPSTLLEKLPPSLVENGVFSDDGTSIKRSGEADWQFINLQIKLRDFRRGLRKIKTMGGQ